jgi:hypothetical protein
MVTDPARAGETEQTGGSGAGTPGSSNVAGLQDIAPIESEVLNRTRRTTKTRNVESMAELTKLESKLGEVTGLATAAQAATKKVTGLAVGEAAQEKPDGTLEPDDSTSNETPRSNAYQARENTRKALWRVVTSSRVDEPLRGFRETSSICSGRRVYSDGL